MEYMQVLVEKRLHNQVKAHAALLNETIREYTERALRLQLADSPIARGQGVLLEPRAEYETQEAS